MEKKCENCANVIITGYDAKKKRNIFECSKLFTARGNGLLVDADDSCTIYYREKGEDLS